MQTCHYAVTYHKPGDHGNYVLLFDLIALLCKECMAPSRKDELNALSVDNAQI